jgi:hypothetical protein
LLQAEQTAYEPEFCADPSLGHFALIQVQG